MADFTILAPIGRDLPKDQRLDTHKMALAMSSSSLGHSALALENYEQLAQEISHVRRDCVLLFMSNGDFRGMLKQIKQFLPQLV